MSGVRGVGLDVGSTTFKAVAVDGSGTRIWERLEPMDPRLAAQAEAFLAAAAEELGALDGVPVVATGYGRNLVGRADRKVTEITCHAKGVFATVGHPGTLIDIGGQDSKVIVVGPTGRVASFAMNDKCAAGTGRFLEVVSGRLRMPLDHFAETALEGTDEVPISSTCTVFAETEMVSLLARGHEVAPIVRGLHRSLVQRVVGLARSAGLAPPVMLSGGVARSPAVRALLAEALGHPVEVAEPPQLMGAYGAALLAAGQQP